MANQARPLTRGALAEKTDVDAETVRYYEKIALMPDPMRSEGGHRLYDEAAVRRLVFIRRCRELGFCLSEIRDLLGLVDEAQITCAEVRSRTAQHLEDVTNKIRDLRRMERTLKNMIKECDGDLRPECPIIETLFASR